MSLKNSAKETLQLIEKGEFTTPTGEKLNFKTEQQVAETDSRLYTPEQLDKLLENPKISKTSAKIEVTKESTQAAVRRLYIEEGCEDIVVLNFASARNPGGGFLNGAKAQEEDLCRCSGLYPCLLTQDKYYSYNRKQDSLLYSHHIIYSPHVPWFRHKNRDSPNELFFASVITAPAPNAGQYLRKNKAGMDHIKKTLIKRAGYILSIAKDNGHKNIILGAWGCGVFQNKASMVADAFGQWLDDQQFAKEFDRVVFAIFASNKDSSTFNEFNKRFSAKI